jgi:hypothetical protein
MTLRCYYRGFNSPLRNLVTVAPPTQCPGVLGIRAYEEEGGSAGGWAAFLFLSVALNVACVVVTVFILSRRGWN